MNATVIISVFIALVLSYTLFNLGKAIASGVDPKIRFSRIHKDLAYFWWGVLIFSATTFVYSWIGNLPSQLGMFTVDDTQIGLLCGIIGYRAIIHIVDSEYLKLLSTFEFAGIIILALYSTVTPDTSAISSVLSSAADVATFSQNASMPLSQ